MFKLPVIGTLCHAQSKGYGDRCVAKEICGEGVFFDVRKTRQVNDFFAAVLSEMDFLHDSPVIVFLDRGHPRFRSFYSTIPVDVIWIASLTLRVLQ